MKKVEVIIKASRLDDVKEAVHSIGVQDMTVTEVRGLGRHKGHNEIYRGLEYVVDFVPQIKIEMVVQSSIVDQLIEKVISATKTGTIGDGKIFVLPVETAVRIETGERDFDRLFQKDSSTDALRFYGGGEETYDRAALSYSEGGKAKRPGRYTGLCERVDVSPSQYGPSAENGAPQRDRSSFFFLESCHMRRLLRERSR